MSRLAVVRSKPAIPSRSAPASPSQESPSARTRKLAAAAAKLAGVDTPEKLIRHDVSEFVSSEHQRVVEDLLEFSLSSRGGLKLEPVDLGSLAAEVVEDLRRSDPGRRDLRVDVALEAAPRVRGDLGLLRQVLSNLVGNALKFTAGRAGAEVEIGWSTASEAPDLLAFARALLGAGVDLPDSGTVFLSVRRQDRPAARILGYSTASREPENFTTAPIGAIVLA